MLPVPRAVEVCDQPTLRRRGAILEELDPGRAAQVLEGLSADERTDIVRGMGERERGAGCCPSSSDEVRAEVERLLLLPAAHGGRHHDHRVRPPRARG